MGDPGQAKVWVGPTEAGRMLGVHPNTIRNWVKEGRLPSVNLPFSGYTRIAHADVLALKEEMDRERTD